MIIITRTQRRKDTAHLTRDEKYASVCIALDCMDC